LDDYSEFAQQINDIFGLDGIGYELIYRDSRYIFIRMDSKYLHAKVTKKTLTLLSDDFFKTPLEEFIAAHEHYRHKRYGEAITLANSAFESVIKLITGKRSGDASQLIAELNKTRISGEPIIPPFYDGFQTELKKLLQALPTTRNKFGAAHGKGDEPLEVDKSYSAFALHLAGTYIAFLVERFEELKYRNKK
jgi:hypothetical protein